ncbi:MAG: NADP-dependent isocitrate dehydrogenase [Candidatus Neomarinimicrobiota bacterium]|nr:NADP-dependent isocitrate dehydrogenase [Candidatus Neomarinimicrobiota bacterium]RKY47130.1 MAG: NADP-dependent isocitrate dehydrogenase [Candidatus Neomarinimicrobiota bacterium]HDN59939.1 NADP-dependent isocitrate dehydrogenase [Candidatus Neomarinimicrobiota bacterium]
MIEIPYIEGDGIGPEIFNAMKKVIDFAFEKTYNDKIKWIELLAGQKALNTTGELLPQNTIEAIKRYKTAIKGPLMTPVGSGYRSLNVTLRQVLDLYACIRPVKYVPGVPSPLKNPEKVDIIVFRENTEDVYAGIEWEAGSKEAERTREYLKEKFGISLREDTGIGLKPISKFASQRIVKKAVEYALKNNRKKITIVHKGNIMKYTEGAFRKWAYEIIEEKLKDEIDGKIEINDIITDNMFQQIILHPENYDVIVTTNLNGDYLSDATAALIGGIGLTAGVNMSDEVAVFEPVHGTAPDIAGKGLANPTAMILAGSMLLEYLGFGEAQEVIIAALKRVLESGKVTKDLALLMGREKYLSTGEFSEKILEAIEKDTV